MLRQARAFALAGLTLAMGAIFGVFASDASAGAGRHAALVIDGNTGAVLHEEQADEPRHPASLTKMMTLYLTFETMESGRLKPSDQIVISQAAASVAPSKLDLDPGERISVSDAILAVVTKSANDIAVALAERIGGSEANFVRLMNTRAREIGMSRTHFVNASGLPDDDQVTTARDMATLALHLEDDYPAYFPLFATRTFTYEGKSYRNHNTMLNSFAGVDGIKTGYTRASGFNLVSSVHRGERHLIGVVFGGETAAVRNGEMRILLTRALTRASTRKTRKAAPMFVAKLTITPRAALRPFARSKPKPAPAVALLQAPAAKPAPQPQLRPAIVAEADPALLAMQKTYPPAAEPEEPDAPLQIFKVKQVAIADKARSPDETTDMEEPDRAPLPRPLGTASRTDLGRFAGTAAGAGDNPLDAIAKLAAMPDSDASETMIAKSPDAAAPETAPRHADGMAMLGGSDIVPPITPEPPRAPEAAKTVAFVPDAAAEAPAPEVATQPAEKPAVRVRGTRPSTLGAQAGTIRTAAKPRTAGNVATSSSDTHYEVQIGAYGSIDEAQRALTSVQGRNSKLLSGIASVTHPGVKDGHQVFRARFTGLDAGRAASTCNLLRRQSVDCFVMAAQ